jgi:hypothetical protein
MSAHNDANSEAALLEIALKNARTEGEAAGRAAAAAEAESAKRAAEEAARAHAQSVLDWYAHTRDANPALAAAWMSRNQGAYIGAARRARGER